ncbi:MAG: ABC transporter permease [Candidatus Bathyarchaeota archaeon]|nr:ABC transporter permease [Candidatus Bathyarchaeota archaeon]MDH5623464.1 ABC transporter permease [Candidatus Bathyarchaeota archaeon]MDH5701756.1 ABC transporter permease [Candidatus Bathyarchaeota archaeon]
MRIKRIFSMAWESMRQRKLRAFLTTLGVVIGITAIIALASLGEGFRVSITERMEQGFELDVLTVIPGSLFAGYRYERFKDTDVENISRIANVSAVTPVMQIGSVTLYNGEKKATAFVAAATNFSEFQQVFSDRFELKEEAMPDPVENDTLIIGYKVNYPNKTETAFAFPREKINVTLSIPKQTIPPSVEYENYSFTVAGTLQEGGTSGLTNFDYWVFLPLDTARKIYETSLVDLIFVKVPDPEFSENVAEEIDALFPPYQITVLVPLSFIQQVDLILGTVQIFLTAIASISLLVAGIGIMNIMTVSVMERTREIGILKAIGAKSRTILTMFLAESLLIGLVGSLIGVPSGFGLAHVLSYIIARFAAFQPDWLRSPEVERVAIAPIFSWSWVIIAVVFGIAICILFGLYPARKAAKLDPVEALRYE